jgi:hypothetical protein
LRHWRQTQYRIGKSKNSDYIGKPSGIKNHATNTANKIAPFCGCKEFIKRLKYISLKSAAFIKQHPGSK